MVLASRFVGSRFGKNVSATRLVPGVVATVQAAVVHRSFGFAALLSKS
jgi:hypothetical protein